MTVIKTLRRTALCLSPLLFVAAHANAQAIERHLPETPQGRTVPLAAPNAVPDAQDATPIGPALRAIVLLGPNDAVYSTASAGVTVGAVDRLRPTDADGKRSGADIAARLKPFLGQALSRKLIAEIEAAIARDYRDMNYPFVSLSTPEQEIDAGVLQVRVIEFHAGDVSVAGTRSPAEATALRARVGLASGQAINARELTTDLDQINRYPFRQVQAAFTPGDALGVTNLRLAAEEGQPWQVYGGYSNDGSPSTSFDRYFVGGAIGNLLGADSVLSGQATSSRDALNGKKDPHYRSLALNYSLPVGRRGGIEASADLVETYQTAEPFTVRLKAAEGSLGYRMALSDLYGDRGATDVRFGVEARHQTGSTYFSGLDVYDVSMDVYQAYAGLHHASGDGAGAANWDLALHMSPGGIGRGNSAQQLYLYSQGRVAGATYSYLTADYQRLTALPGGLDLNTQAIGQFTPIALPRTEQAGMGGDYLVRGYTLDDGSADTALILRNELHWQGMSWGQASADPYLFADLGHGRDNLLHSNVDLASAGLGGNVRLLSHVALKLDAAVALAPDHKVRAGDVMAHTRLQLAF